MVKSLIAAAFSGFPKAVATAIANVCYHIRRNFAAYASFSRLLFSSE